MQVPLQITMHDIARSDALESNIRERVAKLRDFRPAHHQLPRDG